MSKVFPPDRFGALKNCAMVAIGIVPAAVFGLGVGAWILARIAVGIAISPFLRDEEETASVTLGER